MLLASVSVSFADVAVESQAPAKAPFQIVCTNYPLYIFASNVARGVEGVEVNCLVRPSGGHSHDLTLRPSEIRRMQSADVLIEMGLGYEAALERGRHLGHGEIAHIRATDAFDEDELIIDAHRHGEAAPEHRHEPGNHEGNGHHVEAYNPHVWSSPQLAAKMVTYLGEELGRIDLERADLYRENAESYAATLTQLAEDLAGAAEQLRAPGVVLSHPSLAYFARDLGIPVILSIRGSDEQDPTPRKLARQVDLLRGRRPAAILYDREGSGRLARVIAAELKGKAGELAGDAGEIPLIEIDSASSGPLEPGAYEATQRRNLQALREALRAATGVAPGQELSEAPDG